MPKKQPITRNRPGLSGQQIRTALNEDKESSNGTSSEEEDTDNEEIPEPEEDHQKEPCDESDKDDSDMEVSSLK